MTSVLAYRRKGNRMKNIKLTYLFLLGIVSAAWVLAADFSTYSGTFMSLRGFMVDYTGFMSIAVMSVAMILAARPRFIEPMINGLDKGYRLHKWLGITALVTSVTHFLFAVGPKWAFSLGLLEGGSRGGRGPRGAGGQELDALAAWLRSQRSLAETVGEWAFYITVVLIALALIKRVAYNRSFNFHRVFSVVYLALVFHALILVKTSYWLQPIGWLTAILLIGGTVSALLSLFGAIGARNRHHATVDKVTRFDNLQQVKIDATLDGRWPGHRAGQFVFVRFNDTKEAHPFTLSSAWEDNNRASFIVKALGDHTQQIVDSISSGAGISIEGPYGEFDFSSNKNEQVWIAGGIGITPFIARMKYLAMTKRFEQPTTLFYCVKEMDVPMIEYVSRAAKNANVKLYIFVEDRDGQINAEILKQRVANWRHADYWFCGPTQFGKAIQSDLVDSGIAKDAFHQELFEMR